MKESIKKKVEPYIYSITYFKTGAITYKVQIPKILRDVYNETFPKKDYSFKTLEAAYAFKATFLNYPEYIAIHNKNKGLDYIHNKYKGKIYNNLQYITNITRAKVKVKCLKCGDISVISMTKWLHGKFENCKKCVKPITAAIRQQRFDEATGPMVNNKLGERYIYEYIKNGKIEGYCFEINRRGKRHKKRFNNMLDAIAYKAYVLDYYAENGELPE